MKDYLGYQGKTCVITGASSGMGKALAERLVDLGADVVAISRRACPVQGVRASIQADLSDPSSIDKAFAAIPDSIDCFFGNAGASGSKTPALTTFDIDFNANKYITEAYLKERMGEGGAILYNSSAAGLNWRKFPEESKAIAEAEGWKATEEAFLATAPESALNLFAYLIAKRAVCYYSAAKAVELGKRGIRVNALCPGATSTGMKDEFEKMAGGAENLVANNGIAGRLAESREMAGPMLFLNSDLATFVSGIDLSVDYCDSAMVALGLKQDQMNIPMSLLADED
jgi:NAD(P)-dependent dehydrogenase (short-subunit alcohol dehydrogenase family)